MPNATRTLTLGLATALCAVLPAGLAAARAPPVADAAHDEAIAVVLGWAPSWGSTVVAGAGSLFRVFPIGTQTTRAVLAIALALGAAGGALFALVCRLLARRGSANGFAVAVAAIVTVTPLVSWPFQHETASASGSVVGALLSLGALLALDEAQTSRTGKAWALAAGLLGASASAGRGSLAATGFALLAAAVATPRSREGVRSAVAAYGSGMLAAFATGLVPLALDVARMAREGALESPASLTDVAGASPFRFVADDVGAFALALACVGGVMAWLAFDARPLGAGFCALAVVGLLPGCGLGPVGDVRCGAGGLAGLAAMFALAALPLSALVGAVARAGVPLARVSAALVLLLEAVFAVERADDTLLRDPSRAGAAAAAWDDAVWNTLPPGTLVLLSDPRVALRARAAAAQGRLRSDLAVLVLDPSGRPFRVAPRDIGPRPILEPELVPLLRDLALRGALDEEALSSVASARPVAVMVDEHWPAALARHLVPLALLDGFMPEPRGASDRRLGLDLHEGLRRELFATVADDADLVAASGALLRARAEGLSHIDRDLEARVRSQLSLLSAR